MFFFFQAEDGIRDRNVTGVQTCALPIFVLMHRIARRLDQRRREEEAFLVQALAGAERELAAEAGDSGQRVRSEERRVGKSVDLGGRRSINKNKRLVRLE